MKEVVNKDLEELIEEFILEIEEGSVRDEDIVLSTVQLLKKIVSTSHWSTARELLSTIRTEGRNIVKRLPDESSVSNLIRRALRIVREEYLTLHRNEESVEESLHKIVTQEGPKDDFTAELNSLRPAILDHLNELEVELETSTENIAQQAPEHINSNEVIMTLGYSKTAFNFLKRAAKERKFDVIVASTEPSLTGHQLAIELSSANINTTVIPDSNVFGIMSRVNKVIIGTETVLANGGLRGTSGSHLVALAASYRSVPVLVLAATHQLSPHYLTSPDQPSFNSFLSPQGVLSYEDAANIPTPVTVYNPRFDYVPPDLISLFISNTGGHSPSYIYRHLTELYHPDDYSLE